MNESIAARAAVGVPSADDQSMVVFEHLVALACAAVALLLHQLG
jgi:hypothetical protein